MPTVSIIKCGGYELTRLERSIRESLSMAGFDPVNFHGARVAVKPNLLRAVGPESAVVTHPSFFQAMVRIIKAEGGTPLLVESPAFQSLEKVFSRTGYDTVVSEESIEVWDNNSTSVLHNPNGERYKRFEVASPLFDSDMIVNLPKLKTHGITYLTGAVKNLFGTITGLNKSKWHMRAKGREEFAGFLLDLYGAFLFGFEKQKTIFHCIDGIVAMEGEGPGPSGTPVNAGIIIAGSDAVAVDAVAAMAIGLEMKNILTVKSGTRRGLGEGAPDRINIAGIAPEKLRLRPFAPPRSTFVATLMNVNMHHNLLKNLFVEKPVPNAESCTLCYQCRSICPAAAIDKGRDGEKTPHYNYNKCIRCYCCMEICPEAAISLKRARLQWITELLG